MTKCFVKKILLLIFILAVFLFSCKKYGNGYVKGTVTNITTYSPAEGVAVILIVEKKEAKGSSYYTTNVIETTTTDADGSYRINFKKLRGWEYTYKVYLGASVKFCIPNGSYKNLTEKKTNINFDVADGPC